MDGFNVENEEPNIVTCRPDWLPNSSWRDHWMQAAYCVPLSSKLNKGDDYTLCSFHDEFSLWFQIKTSDCSSSTVQKIKNPKDSRPICDCGVHTVLSRSRIALLNDERRNDTFLKLCRTLKSSNKKISSCLVISDSSLLSLCAAALNVSQHVFVLESEKSSAELTKQFIAYNGLTADVTVICKNFLELKSKDFHDTKVLKTFHICSARAPSHNMLISCFLC